jgi:hypothetical protein
MGVVAGGLPAEEVEAVRSEPERGRKGMMVGDGGNDALAPGGAALPGADPGRLPRPLRLDEGAWRATLQGVGR